MEIEKETRKEIVKDNSHKYKIKKLEHFLYNEYPKRLSHVQRCMYLGVTPDESRHTLEMEAYESEQELRALIGKKQLDVIHASKLF